MGNNLENNLIERCSDLETDDEDLSKLAGLRREEENPTPTTLPYIIGPSGEVIFLKDGKPMGRARGYNQK
jgi:hypothetical protein